MCSAPIGKTSFRIDDILDTKTNRIVSKEEIRSDNSVFRPYRRDESFSTRKLSLESEDFSYSEKYRRSSIGSSSYGYGLNSPRLQYSPLSFGEQYGSYFSNVSENAHHWPLPVGFLNYGYSGLSNLGYQNLGYYRPGSSLVKRKGGQVRFTPQQTQNLEKRFGAHKYLSPEDRKLLAGQLKLSDRQVKTWFQNRRAKWRRANNITNPECEEIESDNQSDEELSSNPNRTIGAYQKSSSIFIGR